MVILRVLISRTYTISTSSYLLTSSMNSSSSHFSSSSLSPSHLELPGRPTSAFMNDTNDSRGDFFVFFITGVLGQFRLRIFATRLLEMVTAGALSGLTFLRAIESDDCRGAFFNVLFITAFLGRFRLRNLASLIPPKSSRLFILQHTTTASEFLWYFATLFLSRSSPKLGLYPHLVRSSRETRCTVGTKLPTAVQMGFRRPQERCCFAASTTLIHESS